MESILKEIEFERLSPFQRAVKRALINPLANYLPAGLLKDLLRLGKSELAAANWVNPGGWRSMVISYRGEAKEPADRILIKGGTIPMALRNRRKLAGRVIAELIDACQSQPVHVLCLGAGPGHIINDALARARRQADATLVDLNPDCFEYGRQLALQMGTADRIRFIQGDARQVKTMLDRPIDVVKMIGICEYLDDAIIVDIVSAVAGVMRPGGAIVFNSISRAHGTDRFFRRVFGLHMIHRTDRHLEGLMAKAGFADFCRLDEPLGVYQVIVGRVKR
ncbi:MAG: class I SAM-dependent methyltransferase [Planctomycetes bacterium]|nr:class I SAM-dependent methyltransferase [Planctomycetota bacterium]